MNLLCPVQFAAENFSINFLSVETVTVFNVQAVGRKFQISVVSAKLSPLGCKVEVTSLANHCLFQCGVLEWFSKPQGLEFFEKNFSSFVSHAIREYS